MRFFYSIFIFFIPCVQTVAQPIHRMAFISDTQGPVWAETLFTPTERNVEATTVLFNDLSEQPLSAAFMLGDMVATCSNHNWQRVDHYISLLYRNRIPAYAIPGNHEYMFSSSAGREKFIQRFGYQASIGYAKTIDSVSVVLLNSNTSKLTRNEQQLQMKWYMHTMDSLEKARGTKAIIVCTHHSPYTNSKVVHPSEEVQQRFVPKFLQTSKARLFLSGHSHNMECFEKSGKYFLVIGGGGGLRQSLLTGKKQRYDDRLYHTTKPRFFYVLINRKQEKLYLEFRGFPANNFSTIATGSMAVIDIK